MEIYGSVQEKKLVKDMDCNWNLQMQIDKDLKYNKKKPSGFCMFSVH